MRKLLVRFFAVMGALLLLCGAVDLMLTRAVVHDFEQRVEELRAAGEPVDFESLAGPHVPDGENAAPILIRAAKWYEDRGRDWREEGSNDWGDERYGFEPEVLWKDDPPSDHAPPPW